VVSQLIHNESGRYTAAFLRLSRGEDLVDHHCFFFFEGPKYHVHHASFETHDFDIQVLGHDWLRHKGYENCWGVGRHIMGSQIFDYWYGKTNQDIISTANNALGMILQCSCSSTTSMEI